MLILVRIKQAELPRRLVKDRSGYAILLDDKKTVIAIGVIGLGLKQGADSAVFTAGLIGVAVLMIGLRRVRRTRR